MRLAGDEFSIAGEQQVYLAAACITSLPDEAIIFMHELGIAEVNEKMFCSMSYKSKLDSFFASTDERLHAFASQALVYSSSVSHKKGSADD